MRGTVHHLQRDTAYIHTHTVKLIVEDMYKKETENLLAHVSTICPGVTPLIRSLMKYLWGSLSFLENWRPRVGFKPHFLSNTSKY